MRRALLSFLLLSFLAACSTSRSGRTQLTTPAPLQGFSAVYSEFDMRLQLVIATNAPACSAAECAADRAFDQRILVLGKRLAEIAFRQHADLQMRFPRFEFVVADKADAGTASSAGGIVAIFRGVKRLELDDAALAFVLAREMSHVIAGHHDENVTTSILVAVAAQILFPVLNIGALFSGSAATTAAATTAASSVVTTTAVTSAASFAGSRALRASFRPQQVREAEIIAMELLAAGGWDGREVSEQLQALRAPMPDEPGWTVELRESALRIASLMQGPAPQDNVDAIDGLQITPELPLERLAPAVKPPF
jgi:Zn-dependent protease with chaperone function